MALLNFVSKEKNVAVINPQIEAFLKGFSIEVMPRTVEKIDNLSALLPRDTRVYIAHIEGTTIQDMVATAKRIAGEG